MGDQGDPASVEKCFWMAIVAFCLAIVCQLLFLQCLCPIGSAKVATALAADVAVFVRLVIARIRNERGAVWLIYSILPFLFIPIIEVIAHYYVGH